MSGILPGPPHQDFIVLAGLPSPGVAIISGAALPFKWDIQEGRGYAGATSVFVGQKLIEFDVTFRLWQDFHFPAYDLFCRAILEIPTALVSLSIQHPILNHASVDVHQVGIKSVGQLEQVDDTGLWEATWSFVQYRKPKPMLGPPFQGPPGNPVVVPPPVDPELLQIQANSAQIAKLSGG